MHSVAVIALPDVSTFDLSTAVEIFQRASLSTGEPGYQVTVCGTAPVVTAGPLRIAADCGIDALGAAQTIVVPGRRDLVAETPPRVLEALRTAYASGTRIASICTGAFTLGATGLLDGKSATTHWLAADLFRRAFPAVNLDPNVLYVDEGQVLTSAGASAGIDLCLHMVQRDHGSAVAASAARLAVAPLHRSGGQAQFIVRNLASHEDVGGRTDLGDVLAWIEEEAHRPLTLGEIANRAAVSPRTLSRRFQAATRQSPMQWVNGVRVRHAQQLLEGTSLGVERIGRESGFGSPANFRDQFCRLTGVSPRHYRNTFGDHAKS